MSRFSLGFRTLLLKEIRRFWRVAGQTVMAPLVTTTLYFVIFGFTPGARGSELHGLPYARYIMPGLLMLGVVTNAFANASSSFFMMKLQGTIVDLLVAPLSHAEVLTAFVLAAVVRGLVVGGCVWMVGSLFTGFEVAHPLWLLVFVVLVAAFFGAAGLVVAIWADKFEQLNLFPSFIVTPLTFLGGVFYSVARLPPLLQSVARVNPVLYMVEGARYALLGRSDIGPWSGLALVGGLTLAALALAWRWLSTGYKLRS